MDIVDKVFFNLNLSYDADRERARAARVRQKESLARKRTRLSVVAGVVVTAAVVTGAAIWLPAKMNNQTVADSEIAVVFNKTPESSPVSAILKAYNGVAEMVATAEEAKNETGEVKVDANNEAKSGAPTNNETTAVVNAARRSANNASRNTTVKQAPSSSVKTEIIWHTVDSGEQIDQGANDNCRVVSAGSNGTVLWCSDNSTTTPTTDEEADEPEESEEKVETKDEGLTGGELQ